MVNDPRFPLALPLDLSRLLDFTLSNPFSQTLANASCNDFFEPYTTQAGTGRIRVRRDEKRCWNSLPIEWREHFEAIKDESMRTEMLKELSVADESSSSFQSLPSTLQSYLRSCRTLSFPRECSTKPILSFPPSPSSSRPLDSSSSPSAPPYSDQPQLVHLKGKAKAHHSNALKAGQSPKKQHEVVQFCSLVKSMLEEQRCKYCVDVGSGRAHLSRALASPPLDLHVLALDWSSSQKSGAEKLDSIRSKAELSPLVGSLTHRVSSLDEPGVRSVLEEWPPAIENERREPPLLVALHACGDLSPDSIKAFTSFSRSSSSSLSSKPRAVFVGCCYNLQTPELFPLSHHISTLLPALSLSPQPITLAHLRLTPQSPPTWHLSPSSTTAFLSATSKLAYRSRLEAELEFNGFGTQVGERKVGRIGDCRDWCEYRVKAMSRMEAREGKSEVKECEFEDWSEGLWLLRVWWTLRSWLGPAMESLVVLDRYLLLLEGLYGVELEEVEAKRQRVEMVNLFDQSTGSLRNIALVVR